jgi:hypothetical protein
LGLKTEQESAVVTVAPELEQSSSVGEYIPTTSTINSAPRFDHNPVTGESLGLFVEEQRTNLVLNSADVSQWQAINSAVVNTNQVTAPDGTLTGDGVTAALTSSNVTQQVTITSSTNTYTVSCFVRNNNAASSRIDGYVRAGSIINVSAGVTVDWNALTATGTGAAASVRLTPYLNGWYRLSYSIADNNAASDNLRIQFFPDTITGNKQIYLWGLQYEQGAFPTSYIPTTTATATRSADVASITGSAFSSWYRQDEGTFYGDAFRFSAVPATDFPVIADSRVGTDRLQIGYLTEGLASAFVQVAGVAQAEMYPGSGNARNRKVAFAAAADNFGATCNGAAVLTDSSGSMPTAMISLGIGSHTQNAQYLNGHIRRLTYWPQRLGNEVLQRITT